MPYMYWPFRAQTVLKSITTFFISVENFANIPSLIRLTRLEICEIWRRLISCLLYPQLSVSSWLGSYKFWWLSLIFVRWLLWMADIFDSDCFLHEFGLIFDCLFRFFCEFFSFRILNEHLKIFQDKDCKYLHAVNLTR